MRSNVTKPMKKFQILLDPLKKHQRVMVEVRIKKVPVTRKKQEENTVKRKLDVSKVQNNPDTALLCPDEVDDIKRLTHILTQAAKSNNKEKSPHKPWFDQDCKLLKSQNVTNMQNNITDLENHNLKKQYKQMIKDKRTIYEEEKILEKCKEAVLKPWEMFEKSLSPSTININILQEHFKLLLSKTHNLNVHFLCHTEMTQNQESQSNENAWYNLPIDMKELTDAINTLKNKKACGMDNIFNEHIKLSFDFLQEWWLTYLNTLLNKSEIPESWRTAKLKTLYKGKGNLLDPNTYRGIALMSTAYKLYTKILNNKIILNLDDTLPPEQYGFRKNRNCEQAIGLLRSDIKRNLAKPKGSTYCVFVDFQKAFDSIDHVNLLEKLKIAGIQGKVYKAIQNIISYNLIKVDNGIETARQSIKQDIGVIQGDPLSATLFLLYIREIPDILKQIKNIDVIMFADDLVVYSTDRVALQESLNKLHEWCSQNSLVINLSKTRSMKFRNGGKLKYNDDLFLNNEKLEYTNVYEYLGVTMQPTLTISKHITAKSIKASHAIGSVKHMQKLSLDTINKIYKIKIQPTVSYSFGVLSQDLTWNHLIQLDKIKAKFYKKCLGLHKNSSNTLVLHMVNAERYGNEVIQKYGINMKKDEIQKYRNVVEKKNMDFTVNNFTDGPIFRSYIWKKHGQSNRHLLARYTTHGFHHKICKIQNFHTNYEDCICNICNLPIINRYHLDTHISPDQSLTKLLISLDSNNTQ